MGPEIPQPGEETSSPGHSPQVGDIDVSVIPLSPSSLPQPGQQGGIAETWQGQGGGSRNARRIVRAAGNAWQHRSICWYPRLVPSTSWIAGISTLPASIRCTPSCAFCHARQIQSERKQHLRIKQLYGTSENAVKTQISRARQKIIN
jgi:hypothetical protein